MIFRLSKKGKATNLNSPRKKSCSGGTRAGDMYENIYYKKYYPMLDPRRCTQGDPPLFFTVTLLLFAIIYLYTYAMTRDTVALYDRPKHFFLKSSCSKY